MIMMGPKKDKGGLVISILSKMKDHYENGKESNEEFVEHEEKEEHEFYEKYNPIPTRKDAEALEEYLANKLRKEGYGVWFN